MKALAFYYHLPESLIAQNPSSPRDACRLMVLDRQLRQIEHHRFRDLTSFLREGDVLVFNDSKVLPARILIDFGGRKIEVFLIRKLFDNVWSVIGKPGKLLRLGTILPLGSSVTAMVRKVHEDGLRDLEFSIGGIALDRLIHELGQTPLPPYIKRSTSSSGDYQTVYAHEEGSVAAPTAGLHFTRRLLYQMSARGIQLEYVTLHVGPGTFLPLKSKEVEEHRMHSEYFSIDHDTALRITKAKKEGRRIIAVGTTSVRVLESCFMNGSFSPGFAETSIYIFPGYRWKCVDGLVTNFHLPKSTLLLLACSFGGTQFVLDAYLEAIKRHYRFYSFGDAMLIL